ncbi:hypothetical protein MKW98_025462 [Papaver atlanticum]|uniref:Uncharacterized protein n=1 Tax=Papaver atlanticum TaxID=357466 RepID=A0AAD4SBK3_9MAGN|nr:hypothetical protein MKW98_025462 [Papaver atlanticum]
MSRGGGVGITNAVNVGIAVQADWENREFISNIYSQSMFAVSSISSSILIRFASTDLQLHGSYIPGSFAVLVSSLEVDMQQDATVTSGRRCYQLMPFSAFEDAGLDNKKAVKEIRRKFRETVLALGGGKPPLEVFVQFRGSEPSPEALLRHNGSYSVCLVWHLPSISHFHHTSELYVRVGIVLGTFCLQSFSQQKSVIVFYFLSFSFSFTLVYVNIYQFYKMKKGKY